jgi:hypothetical protein
VRQWRSTVLRRWFSCGKQYKSHQPNPLYPRSTLTLRRQRIAVRLLSKFSRPTRRNSSMTIGRWEGRVGGVGELKWGLGVGERGCRQASVGLALEE